MKTTKARYTCHRADNRTNELSPHYTTQMLRQYVNFDPRSLLSTAIHSLFAFLKTGGLRAGNILKNLRIPIDQRKPGTLHLHHNTMATTERVIYVRHRKINFLNLSGRESLRSFETLAKFPAHRLPSNKLLVTRHFNARRRHIGGSSRARSRVLRIAFGINVDQFHDPVRIRAAGRYKQFR